MTGILGPGPSNLAKPTVTPPARMPDPDDPAVLEAKRRQVAAALARGGRSSTILTGPGGDTRATAPPAGVASADSYAGTNL